MRAHPRSRGENGASAPLSVLRAGSSPLTRGKPVGVKPSDLQWRLIPAHAGKTPLAQAQERQDQAHPRSRGENLGEPPPRLHAPGSSPLTRGKPSRAPPLMRSGRLIPAHAGKTFPVSTPFQSGAAHPRSRGENDFRFFGTLPPNGSSPLTRGKPLVQARRIREEGLIPAHAGKTSVSSFSVCRRRAHPRSRGENDQAGITPPGGAGSSPLTRGKLGRPCA